MATMAHHARRHGLPILYVNQVGGQDDIVYDGASFALNANGELVLQCEEFIEEFQTFSFTKNNFIFYQIKFCIFV